MMEKFQFKTNMACGGCVSAVAPHLDAVEGIEKWEADIESPDKVLTVVADGAKPHDVIEALARAGYEAKELQ